MDWLNFLDTNRITYDTRGKNVSGNHVAISCPWCGGDDPSRHLAISLDGAGWHCWRNRQHRGRSPVTLILALIHCSVAEAQSIAGERNSIVPDNLVEMVQNLMQPKPKNRPLIKPAEFRPFQGQYTSQRFVQYLRSRGFPAPLEDLTKQHDMYYAGTGRFFGRVLFMVRSPDGELMAWIGRSIYPHVKLRYMTEGPIGDYLLWLDRLPRRHSHTLVLNEGPIDALKVDVFGLPIGVDATCCFTSTPTDRQIGHLYKLCEHYENRYIMLDEGEVGNTLWTSGVLAPLRFKPIWQLSRKDPGEIRSTDELRKVLP